MNFGDKDIQYKNALETKLKRENIISNNIPFECKKCGIEKLPKEFVKHYMQSPFWGKIQILHECKECKRKRVSTKRNEERKTIEGTIEIIFKQIKTGAKSRNLHFNITQKDLLDLWNKQNGKCFYTGYPMQTEKTKYQISCDRLNNNLGYIKGNIVLCTNVVNKMKTNLDINEFYQICKDINKKNN